jgi:hypothetical protein
MLGPGMWPDAFSGSYHLAPAANRGRRRVFECVTIRKACRYQGGPLTFIQTRFLPLYGLPCWNVRPGYGSFLTIEFGEPHLKIREPHRASQEASPQVQRLFARRKVVVRGAWHLWIYCCQWQVCTGKRRIGHSALETSSRRPIQCAARELDGQQLVHVELEPGRGSSRFSFDLGSWLETTPYDAQSEQWLLYEPSGMVLTYRADGCYCYQPGDTPPDQKLWLRPETHAA